METVFLRYHDPQKRGRGWVGFFVTEEQWEYINNWKKSHPDNFKVPEFLWPFIELKIRELLGLEDAEPNPLFAPSFWKPPSGNNLIPADISVIDLSKIPIELWHPDSQMPYPDWPYPHPSLSDTQ